MLFKYCFQIEKLVYFVPVLFCLYVLFHSYNYIRKLPVRVICWFCGDRTKVPPGNKNCWDCPKCEQYNGFKEDGGYNKPIPAQYDDSLNFPITAVQTHKKLTLVNGLCDQCNNYQAVKIKLLSSFIPLNQIDFDTEVDAYQLHLDKLYPLCRYCELHVQQKLHAINEKLSQSVPFIREAVKHSLSGSKTWVVYLPILAHLSAISCLSLLLPSTIQQLQADQLVAILPSSQLIVVIGFLMSLSSAAFTHRVRWYLTDAFEILMWILVQLSYTSSFFKQDLLIVKPLLLFCSILTSALSMFNRHSAHKIPDPRLYKMKKMCTTPVNMVQNLDNLSSVKKMSTTAESLPLNLDKVHITPPKQGAHADIVENPFKKKIPTGTVQISFTRKPQFVLSPSRFTSQPITRASWVAGGFWSSSSTNFQKPTGLKAVSSAFLTPPPSVNGSQDSQVHSIAGSSFGDDWRPRSCSCTWDGSVRSWQSSKIDKGSITSFETLNDDGTRRFGKWFLRCVVTFSFVTNLGLLYFLLKS